MRNIKFEKLMYERKEKTRERRHRMYRDIFEIVEFIRLYFLGTLFIVIKALLIACLSIGSVEVIYKFNTILGYGYAHFASYMFAGLLWALLPDMHDSFFKKIDKLEKIQIKRRTKETWQGKQ